MAYVVRTDRGTKSFETINEAEAYGRLSYVRGGTPNYQIERDDSVEADWRLVNDTLLSRTRKELK